MKEIIFYFFSGVAFFCAGFVRADEVSMATSEDLKEFDRILIQAQTKKKAEQKKIVNVIPEKKQEAQNNPRDHFQNSETQAGKKLQSSHPFAQRPPPGAFSPGDNLGAPPPPPRPPPQTPTAPKEAPH